MIKRSTWIVVFLLLLLVGIYLLVRQIGASSTSKATATSATDSYLVNSSDGKLQAIQISDNQNHEFQMSRDAKKAWQIRLPSQGAADISLASAAVVQVYALRILETLEVPPHPNEMGLDLPTYTITISLDNGTEHTIKIGFVTTTNNGYYVQMDAGKYVVVTQPGIDALLKLLTSPPFPPTETPVPTATQTG